MAKLQVAIADDNERILQLLDNIISRDDEFEVVGKANNGEEAYSLIKEKEPDIMLLDIIMPKLDGLSVMEKVGKDTALKKRPEFIVITAIGQERITEDAFHLGASYYIMKPFDSDMVLNRMKHIGKGKHRSSETRKIAPYESKEQYIERNLETESAGNGNPSPNRRSGPYQRIWLFKGCHYSVSIGYGNVKFHYETLVSNHCQNAPDNTQQSGKSHPPCYRGGLEQGKNGHH